MASVRGVGRGCVFGAARDLVVGVGEWGQARASGEGVPRNGAGGVSRWKG